MNRARQPRWIGSKRQQAGTSLPLLTALWLVLHIVYTPFHLYVEPHSDEADLRSAATTAVAGDSDHDGHGHHERHPAAQHKLKVTQPTRVPVAEMLTVQAVECVEAATAWPQSQTFGFSGLSPPELSHCWQFLFRTALPVRAPSLFS